MNITKFLYSLLLMFSLFLNIISVLSVLVDVLKLFELFTSFLYFKCDLHTLSMIQLWDSCNCQGPRKFVVQHLQFDKLTARRCQECGQTLPPTYQPPADEDWSTGIFGCTEDTDSCLTGLFCPCVLFGRNVENLNVDISQRAACVGHIICVEGGMTFAALTLYRSLDLPISLRMKGGAEPQLCFHCLLKILPKSRNKLRILI
ncbi:uncharacterized protein LOC114259490 [Camellia sinensis]|uniref:uncharacterized protein LOC114259490 n=1 Tax=Camellia sinensis TaxID=4442 RepID=UPI0010363372|nr:uncharacterized protein LOC114259490 [Camellia sinensis]